MSIAIAVVSVAVHVNVGKFLVFQMSLGLFTLMDISSNKDSTPSHSPQCFAYFFFRILLFLGCTPSSRNVVAVLYLQVRSGSQSPASNGQQEEEKKQLLPVEAIAVLGLGVLFASEFVCLYVCVSLYLALSYLGDDRRLSRPCPTQPTSPADSMSVWLWLWL